MIEDDHYIANLKNAHIDTSGFERELLNQLAGGDHTEKEFLERIYNLALSRIDIAPEEPPVDQLICRYLTPSKFLQFLDTRCVNFPIATQFSDHWECRVPEDYENAVLSVLNQAEISGDAWSELVRLKAADWNISCWTKLDDYFDDHLLWDSYAGGSQGVGITVRYGILKESLSKSAEQLDRDGRLQSGCVNYEKLSFLPFNKHYMFRNEKEIRFAFRAIQPGAKSVSIDEIFRFFGVRISPAATPEHYEMIKTLWFRYHGEDRVQWPQ